MIGNYGPRTCKLHPVELGQFVKLPLLLFQIQKKPFMMMCQEKIQTLNQVWLCLELGFRGFSLACFPLNVKLPHVYIFPRCVACVCSAVSHRYHVLEDWCACAHVCVFRLQHLIETNCPDYPKEAERAEDGKTVNEKVRNMEAEKYQHMCNTWYKWENSKNY